MVISWNGKGISWYYHSQCIPSEIKGSYQTCWDSGLINYLDIDYHYEIPFPKIQQSCHS